MRYRIRVGRAAKREAFALPGYVRQRVLRIIDALADEPRPLGAKELRDRPGYYRIRVARWRLIYHISDDDGLISIVAVRLKTGPEIYENLP
ncbi:MAG: type II toxin-antitoxin system RelE/ParE family toxin [Chloroflexi bacterium]|nr:type II toxin-antitoxin system RelE/ParE family toxin [Chloroflexota bacterium]